MIASRSFDFNHILQDYIVDWDYSSRVWEWKPLFTYIRENRLFKTSCWESPFFFFFFKEYFKKNNKSSNYYWIYLDVSISKIMKIWFMPTNAGNLLLLLWWHCWCSLLGSKGVWLSPDIPGTARKGGLSWERPPCLPLAGCVTFGKSHSPLWASVVFWNEGVEFDFQVPLELWNGMSYIRNAG